MRRLGVFVLIVAAITGLAAGAVVLTGGIVDQVVVGHPKVISANGVTAAWLDDNTPVFVVRQADGSDVILAAVSPHRPGGWLGSAVVWCPTSQSFEEPNWSSHFDPDGDYQQGPSPRGLDTYVGSFDGSRVTVVGGLREGRPRGAADPPAGPSCPGRAEPNEHDPWPAGTVAHDTSSPRGLASVVSASTGAFEPIIGSIRHRAGERPAVCDGGCWSIAGAGLSDTDFEGRRSPLLVRVQDGAIVEVVLLAEVRQVR